jgi:general secretion pathway protein D
VVRDQQTVVIGGLMRSRVARTDTKIPLLGDLPVLGALFRSSSSSLQKSNLILVLTPYIVREQADLRAVFERKMQERQEFLDHYFVFSDTNDYQAPKDYSRMVGLLEDIRQSYADVDDQRRLEELQRPRPVKTHEPGQPIDLPTPARTDGPGASEDGATPGRRGEAAPPSERPPAPATLNVRAAPRNVDKTER